MDCILYLLAFSVCMFLFGMALQDTLWKHRTRRPSLVVVALSHDGALPEAEAILRETAVAIQDTDRLRGCGYYAQGWIFKGRGYVMTTKTPVAEAVVRFEAAAGLCRELGRQLQEQIQQANQSGDRPDQCQPDPFSVGKVKPNGGSH